MKWQASVYAQLRANPEDWLVLGDLFQTVREDIPLHHATRHATLRYRPDNMPSVDKATWLFFAHTVRECQVERIGKRRDWGYEDRVRLRAVDGKLCPDCEGPMVKATWCSRNKVICVKCQPDARRRPKPEPTPALLPPLMPLPPPPPMLSALIAGKERRLRAFARDLKQSILKNWSINAVLAKIQNSEWVRVDEKAGTVTFFSPRNRSYKKSL